MLTDGTSLPSLVLLFLFLLGASAYFSGSETGMMRLNRYRLKHLKRSKHPGATRVSKLLDKPDRLIGIILIGNNFVNFLAASTATSIAIVLLGEPAPFLTAVILTIVVLIFAEVTPKTIAALHPEKVAFPSSLLLGLLLKLLYPAVWLVNSVSNFLVRLAGFRHQGEDHNQQLSSEELRTVVRESTAQIPSGRQGMLLNILDLDNVCVDDIMVPRNEVSGIDIEDRLDDILDQIRNSQHTLVPIYKKEINSIIGILHLRSMGRLIRLENLNKAALLQETMEPYFIPESTPLHTQLINFQKKKVRMAVVVNEYGTVKGIVTLEDILEEIVGEFTTDMAASSRDIVQQEDGCYLVDGSTGIRELNRILSWNLDTSGPRTLNGLLMEILQAIPDSSVGVDLDDYYAEIIQIQGNMIRSVKMREAKRLQLKAASEPN